MTIEDGNMSLFSGRGKAQVAAAGVAVIVFNVVVFVATVVVIAVAARWVLAG